MIEARDSSEQRDVRFLKDICRESPFIDIADVRRVRRDEVEHPADAIEVRRADELDPVSDLVTHGVLPRHIESGLRHIGRDEGAVRQEMRDRDGDVAAAGPDVSHPRRLPGHRALNDCRGFLDNEFGLRAGDQHCRSNQKIQAPEFAPADDVGSWLKALATSDPLGECRLELFWNGLVAVEQDARDFWRSVIPKGRLEELERKYAAPTNGR